MVGAEELDLEMDCQMVEVALLEDLLPESPAKHSHHSVTAATLYQRSNQTHGNSHP